MLSLPNWATVVCGARLGPPLPNSLSMKLLLRFLRGATAGAGGGTALAITGAGLGVFKAPGARAEAVS